MLYLDTSVLVAALTHEPQTGRIQDWLEANAQQTFAVSEWTRTELSSALSLKLRAGQLSEKGRAEILAAYARLCADTLTILAIAPAMYFAAARFVDRWSLGLRAGDALHAAICEDHGAMLCTLDQRLYKACLALGIRVSDCRLRQD